MKNTIISAVALLVFTLVACQKQDKWLDVKRNKADVVPETFKDFQALLDNTTILTTNGTAGLAGADNFYFSDANFLSAPELDRNLYTWNKQVWINGASIDWTFGYRAIEYANIVLDGIIKLEPNSIEYNNIKGQALFWRSYSFYNLAQVFCNTYDPLTANNDLGLPLRTTSDVNQIFQRSKLDEVYKRIITDLTEAYNLLSPNPPFSTRPSKAAAAGLLAKCYLVMGDYGNGLTWANNALYLKGTLLDFNSSYLSLSLTYRFPIYSINNPEVLFYAQGQGYTGLTPSTLSKGFILPSLYTSYSQNDLRKTFFYISTGNDNSVQYRGTYAGTNATFTGIATNEIYLIRAECNARLNKTNDAMSDLNLLLRNRFKTGTFINLTANDQDQALELILTERRKELAFTGNVRWEDLRRLNKDSKFAITLTRTVNGIHYTLPANDLRYTLPIPDIEVQVSGLQQNPR